MQVPQDGGMVYAETDLSRFFPEPLNTISSCLFIVIALFWIIKLKAHYKTYRFLSIAVIILFIGSIGGTLYHGLRKYPVFILLDWVPIMVLCIMASIYFISKITKWYYSLAVVLLYAFFQYYLRTNLSDRDIQLFVNINYATMAALILMPLFLFLRQSGYKNWLVIVAAIASFSAALFFRVADKWNIIPTGTHFLWHTFGALATGLMLFFIYKMKEVKSGFKTS